MSRNRLLVLLLSFASLTLVALILTDALPNLRGPAPGTGEWYWPYLLRPLESWWAPFAASAGLLIVAGWWMRKQTRNSLNTAVGLAGLVVANFLLQLGFIYADRPAVAAELIDRTLSNPASGFFEPAAEITNLDKVLRDYPKEMPAFSSEHARTHPPGLIAANWLTIRAFDNFPGISESIAHQVWPRRCTDLWLLDRPSSVAAALGIWATLPLIAGALTAVPTYFLARRLVPPHSARLAAVFAATIPALLLFAPKSVQFYAPLAVTALLTLDIGLERKASSWLFVSGLILSLASFLSFGNVSLLLLTVVYGGLRIWRRRRAASAGQMQSAGRNLNRPIFERPSYSPEIFNLIAFSLGLSSIWLIYWAIWGVSLWSIAQTGLEQHYQLVTSRRRYSWWLIYNLVDLVVYASLPVFVGFVAAVQSTLGRGNSRWRALAIGALAVSVAILIVVLDISGSTRGEVGRLWLFIMPFLALISAGFLAERFPSYRIASLVVGLQLLIAVALGIAWKPVRAVIVVAQAPEPGGAFEPEVSLEATFSDGAQGSGTIQLEGYTVDLTEAKPGGTIDLQLFWQSSGPTSRPFTVFTHLQGSDGSLVAQKDNWPVQGSWPPTCWQKGDQVVDAYKIQLGSELAAGSYSLLVGLYDAANGERLITEEGLDALKIADVVLGTDS